jgi:hypothetical protein
MLSTKCAFERPAAIFRQDKMPTRRTRESLSAFVPVQQRLEARVLAEGVPTRVESKKRYRDPTYSTLSLTRMLLSHWMHPSNFSHPLPLSDRYVSLSVLSSGSGWSEFQISWVMSQEPSACFRKITRNLSLSMTGSPSSALPTIEDVPRM